MVSVRPNRRRLIWGSLSLFLAVSVVASAIAYRKYQLILQSALASASMPEASETVTTALVATETFRRTATAIGTVLAPQSITLRNEVAGTVVSEVLTPGAIVEAGQILVQLDTSIEQAQLDFANAQLDVASSAFKRTERAALSNAAAELEVEQARALRNQALAEVARWEAVIARKTLKAPFRAKLGLSDTHVGQYLSEGTTITTLQGIEDHVFVDFAVAQHVAESLDVGSMVELQIEGESHQAPVVALDSRADRGTRNTNVRARLDQPPPAARPGDSVVVRAAFGPEQTVVTVPQPALRRAPQGAFVYVVTLDERQQPRAHVRGVQTGGSIGTGAAILQGLVAGEQIVVDGSFKVREGSLLNIAQPNPAMVVR
jgi:membrane fusion protein (multidrug efflux system)